MENLSEYKAQFKRLKCCVLIPTYNNERTVEKVIRDVLEYTDDLIVVNDGSTDSTSSILPRIEKIQVVNFEKNRGKGIALREGFRFAVAQGYDFAITLDSDGQHFAHDIPALLQKLDEDRNILIIGARNMDQESVPGKSSFGNKFSSFWYWVITGIRLPDTQSGFRLYPISRYRDIRFYTGKFEFEIEVMVRSAWAGIQVIPVPVSVYYGADRVSHFRPGPDVLRITLLNTLFVLLSFFYIRPKNFLLGLGKKKFREELKSKILGAHESNLQKSLAIAFGVFIGIFPIWGFQLLVGIPLAILSRLNVALVVLAANISFPPMNIVLMYLSYKTGAYFVSNPSYDLPFSTLLRLDDFLNFIYQFALGGVVLSSISALTIGTVSYLLFSLFRKNPSVTSEKVSVK
jgi:glycosyltransferase involved in cell wall biosynthesis